jgi:hypothetical protein
VTINSEQIYQLSWTEEGVIPTSRLVIVNTDDPVLAINKDKLELILQNFVARMDKRDSWQIPLGILASLVLAVTTTTITRKFGISGSEWETVYIMIGLVVVGWLGRTLKRRDGAITPASIVKEIADNPAAIKIPPAGAPISPVQEARAAGSDFGQPANFRYDVKPGDLVYYERYGLGRVRSIPSTASDPPYASVRFCPPVGSKRLPLAVVSGGQSLRIAIVTSGANRKTARSEVISSRYELT